MRLLGFKDPANYDDSWIIYGSVEKNPIENEQRIDFSRIKLEDKIKELETKLKAAGEKH